MRARIVLALTALLLAAGCGSSSSSPSLSGHRVLPRGYAIYRTAGFSFAYPSGWRVSPYRTDSTHGGVSVVPPGPTPVDAAYPRIDTELSAARAAFPPAQDFTSFIENLQGETTFTLPSGEHLADRVSVASVTVPGARSARLATLVGPDQRREQDLVALVPEGVIELKVAWYPANQQLSPDAVIDSLRLG